MSARATVCIFAKPNRMGLAKTRLARDMGWAEAQRVNAFATARVMRQVVDPRWRTLLYAAPDSYVIGRHPAWPAHIKRRSQGTGDLGARLTKGFDEASNGLVLFIGSDAPDLTRHHIWAAVKALRDHDGVFGPADDGGFWLFGVRKRVGSRAPFEDVRWSSEHALTDVRRNLGNARVAYLETLIDLDDGDALRAWNENL